MKKIYESLIFFTAITLFTSVARADAPSNAAIGIVPVKISPDFKDQYQNQPFVSVTLCEPGTQNCQTIDHILLDTGSPGLRLFSSLVHLNLKTELTEPGAEVAECLTFGGGALSDWGPVKNVDVVLGGEKASSIPVQFIDSTYGTMPSTCVRPEQVPTECNGTLGILDAQTDYRPHEYFFCTGTNCTELATVPTSLQVPNPIMKLPVANNGFSITLPKVADAGEKEVIGKLTLGIGTDSKNVPPSLTDPGLIKLDVGQYDLFKVKIDGNQYRAMIDSGTNTWSFPAALNFPSCSGNLSPMICPSTSLPVSVEVLNGTGTSIDTVIANIGDAKAQFDSGKAALSNLAENGPFGNTGMFLAGIPFFYGRTIYFGYTGKSTPIGSGPLLAYKNNKSEKNGTR